MANYKNIIYVTIIGFYFAILQTGYFFQLEIWLTAAYPGFLTLMFAWLAGNLFGLWWGTDGKDSGARATHLVTWLMASVAAYFFCIFILNRYPYRLELLPFYGAMIMISGAHAGHFFRANRSIFSSSAHLFFLENNGFVAGWIAGFFGFIMYGSGFNILAPGALGLLCILLSWFASELNESSIAPKL